VFLTASARAGEAEEREGLAKLLPHFESSWNKGDVSKFMGLFHADCRMKKAYDADEQTRKKVGQAFKELIKEFGEAKGSEIRKYIARKLLLRNNLASAIICLFRFQGWGEGHGRRRTRANPSVSLSRMSVTQRYQNGFIPSGHQPCDGRIG
jgi:hypothetical protein